MICAFSHAVREAEMYWERRREVVWGQVALVKSSFWWTQERTVLVAFRWLHADPCTSASFLTPRGFNPHRLKDKRRSVAHRSVSSDAEHVDYFSLLQLRKMTFNKDH